MTDIFFSYSSRDRDRVQRLRDGLVERGFDVFWDQSVPAGTDWDTWIRRHLNDAKCAIVVWSTHSIASDNVRHEATIAKQQKKLVPVMLDAIAADQFPMGLYAVQAANLASWTGSPDHPEWLKLVNQVESKLTPAWMRATLDTLEAELIGERARRETSERRDRTLRDQIVKEAQARQELQAELDSARDRAATLQVKLDTAAREASQAQADEGSARVRESEKERQALSEQQAAAARISALERTASELEQARADAASQAAAAQARLVDAERRAGNLAGRLETAERELATGRSATIAAATVLGNASAPAPAVIPDPIPVELGSAPPGSPPVPATASSVVAQPSAPRRQIVWAIAPALLGPLFFVAVLLMAVSWQWTWPFPNPPYLGEFKYHAANGATIAAAVWLALIAWQVIRGRATLTGLEIGLYWVAAWLVAAPALVYVGLYEEWNWFDPYGYSVGPTSVFIASISALISGGAIAYVRRTRVEAVERALYFAGCSVAAAVAGPIWFDEMKWQWLGAQVAASPGIVLASLAILATAITIVRRRPSLTRIEVIIYWFVCSVAAAEIMLLLGSRVFGPVGVLPGLAFVPLSGIATYVLRRQQRVKATASPEAPVPTAVE